MSHRFTTRLEEDDFGDLILTIPYEACEELGWDVGTELEYDITEDGTAFTLRAVQQDE
jgi:bifunctional DNA-binding transcriptional regulator/antitoxin component of YhaV-PrlF toxin-antitoxin module